MKMISPNGKDSIDAPEHKVAYLKEKGWKEEAAQTIKSSSKQNKKDEV
jgi:predicted HAD superfamily Cof-like phosphohydrolase|tara:strand:+ start:459 stop:602 length:144 start_codon:yes stop_codon:yes gene_type:complete